MDRRRSLRWAGFAIASLGYWVVWLFITAATMFVHGDCWAGTTHAEAAACADQKRLVGLVVLAVGIVLYVATIQRVARQSRSGK
jgi:uncharacterized protein YjeT (DUF2065 family)